MSDVYDVVIVGSGFTGLSAAIYTTRSRLSTVVLEQAVMGGQIINTETIENYPGFPNGVTGMDLIMSTEEQASKFGAEYGFGQVTGLDVSRRPYLVRTDDEEYEARAVIIAGGGEHVKLGVPGEEEFEAKGVSYCARCDGNFFTDQEVTVVGGGDAAIEEGLYLTRMCKKVTVVHRRAVLRAAPVLQERAFASPKMEFVWDSAVESINGNGNVSSVSVRNLKTEDRRQMETQGVFVYIGFSPLSSPYQGLLEMDNGGHIEVDIKMATNVPGVFAAGDIRWKSTRQLANAAGDGVTAAIAAYEWLQDNE